MTKQEYDNAIKKLDAEIWTAFSSEQVNEIAEKKDEINSQYIASLESQNATLTADNLSLVEQVNECGVKYEKLIKKAALTLQNILGGQTPDWREWLEEGGE